MTHDPSNRFQVWADSLAERDRGPWPGPRPFSRHDATALLVGRDSDAAAFRDHVQGHRLVILDGESGVGKSSLLQASLIPELARVGMVAANCNDWSDDRELDTWTMLGRKVVQAMQSADGVWDHLRLDAVIGDSEGVHLFAALDSALANTCVLVFDQFEELIRHAGARAEEIVDAVLKMNELLSLRVVVSLRSEFVHRTRRLQRLAKPYTLSSYTLLPIDPKDAVSLITAPGRITGAPDSVIASDAAERVAAIWLSATSSAAGGGAELPGVLHLQALLYVLHARAEGGVISAAHVEVLETDAQHRERGVVPPGEPAVSRRIFAFALSEAVDVKLTRCADTAIEVGVDRVLIERARLLAVRCAPQLSSGGYKLLRETGELADNILAEELSTIANGINPRPAEDEFTSTKGALLASCVGEVVAEANRQHERASDVVSRFDLLASPWFDLVETVGSSVLTEWVAAPFGPETDDGAMCGALMGAPAAVGLVEEYRRFALALAWLERSRIVRLTSPEPGTTIVSLIHDRFGVGLNRWAEGRSDGPADAWTATTAAKGVSYFWWAGVPAAEQALIESVEEYRVVPNLRWRGGWVSSPFRRVAFVNCDLRGTMFHRCRFEGVAFVNCLMDGAMLSECTVVGAPAEPAASDWQTHPGQFDIELCHPGDTSMAASWRWYRPDNAPPGDADDPVKLLSPTPGRAAELRPSDLPESKSTGIWTRPVSGVAVYGGRLSTFVVRSPTFKDSELDGTHGCVAFRHMAGSGLDLVELADDARVEIFASAVRSVTISPVVDATTIPEIVLDVRQSALAQVWASEGVRGVLRASDSRVAQMWNESEVEVFIDKTASAYDIVQWRRGSPPGIRWTGAAALEAFNAVTDFRDATGRMDYVKDPWKVADDMEGVS